MSSLTLHHSSYIPTDVLKSCLKKSRDSDKEEKLIVFDECESGNVVEYKKSYFEITSYEKSEKKTPDDSRKMNRILLNKPNVYNRGRWNIMDYSIPFSNYDTADGVEFADENGNIILRFSDIPIPSSVKTSPGMSLSKAADSTVKATQNRFLVTTVKTNSTTESSPRIIEKNLETKEISVPIEKSNKIEQKEIRTNIDTSNTPNENKPAQPIKPLISPSQLNSHSSPDNTGIQQTNTKPTNITNINTVKVSVTESNAHNMTIPTQIVHSTESDNQALNNTFNNRDILMGSHPELTRIQRNQDDSTARSFSENIIETQSNIGRNTEYMHIIPAICSTTPPSRYDSANKSLGKISSVSISTFNHLSSQISVLSDHIVDLNNVIASLKSENDSLRMELYKNHRRERNHFLPTVDIVPTEDNNYGLLIEIIPGRKRIVNISRILNNEELEYISSFKM